MRESYENYLKAIYLISKEKRGGWVSNSDISDFLKVRPSSVTEMLYKLKEKKLILWNPRRSLRLTEGGKEKAQLTIEKYNHLKDFFANTLKVEDTDLLEQLCCNMEHYITKELSKSLKHLAVKSK